MTTGGIVAQGVSFSYDDRKILEDICFRIPQGTVAALIGSNGSGKTTLLRIMAGLLTPESGSVRYNGEEPDVRKWSSHQRNVGFVPQGQRTAFPFTCFDVVLTGRHAFVPVYLTPSSEDEAIALRAMDDVGAGFLKNRQFTRISGGERQLVLIARALASHPRFLILDEPTTFLDLKNQAVVLSLIQKITRDRRLTTVMSIHDPTQAAQFADQILILGTTDGHSSRIIGDGPATMVLNQETLEKAFGIHIRIISDDGMIAVIPGVVK
ncbi:MAG TPA: ABC transporter ATP-binding protein [Methanospirillum sp.]|nr:ABC transporter ATP-binding protein [Methanospirillum sp.]